MSHNIIHINNLFKTFGSIKAVQNINVDVEESTCFGFLGPNGAGKTTLMHMIYGRTVRDKNKKTRINILGYDPQYHELEIKYLSGVVPQENNLDEELNVMENLIIYSKFYQLPKKEMRNRIHELLEFMELNDKKSARIRELSGGMKRRLVIVRALLNKPRLLILDEPTTGLDPQVRHLIWSKLRQLKKEKTTILLTTHYMEEAFQICDRIIIMDKGKKIMEGEPKALLNDNIEKYVIEILNKNIFPYFHKMIRDKKIRKDESNEIMLLYSNDISYLKEKVKQLKPGDYFVRQTNLEDLFLKTTGRVLNDGQ